jgi:alpha-galactosidase
METHIEALRCMALPLVGSIEPGDGFKIGNAKREFSLVETDGSVWTYYEVATGLQVTVELRVVDQTVVLSTLLENKGSAPISGLEVMEPLRIVFNGSPSQWRHIYASGGTFENFYPPTAFTTHDQTGMDWSLKIESHPTGRSSNLHLPFFISLASKSADAEGLFCGMEWSGAWQMVFWKEDETHIGLCVGVRVHGLTLAAGETLRLPEVHLGFFRGGAEAGTNALRKHLYEQVCPAYQGKPVLPRVSYDHWFGIYNNLNLDVMKREADRAAELGVEVFVVDAAWFPGDFSAGVGNWDDVDRSKFPDGLEPLAEYVRNRGMDFGLWFEIERANEGTRAFIDHPEFFIPRPGGRDGHNFAHLNLARRDAQDWAIETISDWIKRLDLRWSRWDYNIEPQPYWDAMDASGKIQFEYCKGLYHVLDTLMARHPNWMVEASASGGRRIDIGTMKRAHTYWFSDQTEIPELCRYMQARANRFLPGHLLNSSVAVGEKANDAGFDDTAILSRMLGKLGFDGAISRWSPVLTARMARWVGIFKAIRPLLVQDFYQLLPQPQAAEDWDAVQFVSYSGAESVVFAFAGNRDAAMVLRLRGLQKDRPYSVMQMPDGMSTIISGETLMKAGLPVSLEEGQGGLWRITLKGKE